MNTAKNASDHLVLEESLFENLIADQKGYTVLADYLKIQTGISMPLNPKNLTLMAARLSKLMAKFGISSYAAFAERLKKGDAHIQRSFIEALTTNRTEFFRENSHFILASRLVPDLLKSKLKTKGSQELRIWCAAASRGHEPYSILFTLLEAGLDPKRCRLHFLASDIDRSVLETASKGVYLEDELQSVPPEMLQNYFHSLNPKGSQKRFGVKDEFREMITFANFNLIAFPYKFQHKFDIIFCRNVMIYFERDTIIQVKNQLASALAPQGYLFIGHSETGSGKIDHLKTIDNGVFQKVLEEG